MKVAQWEWSMVAWKDVWMVVKSVVLLEPTRAARRAGETVAYSVALSGKTTADYSVATWGMIAVVA